MIIPPNTGIKPDTVMIFLYDASVTVDTVGSTNRPKDIARDTVFLNIRVLFTFLGEEYTPVIIDYIRDNFDAIFESTSL